MTQDAHERWQLIDSIFAQAIELPPQERAPFLEQTCTGEPDIRREVEALIQLNEEAEDLQFLENPVIKFEVPLMPGLNSAGEGNAGAPADGQRIGAYRLIKEIGQGGMGCVYLAERVDGQYRQRVALKLLRQGMTSQEILRRFRLERQILARLQHPNIALLLDGGVTEGRLPYFVMQYIDG